MPTPTMPPGKDITFILSDKLKLEIASAVILFSKMESCATEVVWHIKGADLALKKKIARMPASGLASEIRKAMASVTPIGFEAVWSAFEELANERNLIAHGVWMVADGRPFVVWHKFIEDEAGVIGEWFDEERFQRFMAKGDRLFMMLVELKNIVDPAGAPPEAWRPRS